MIVVTAGHVDHGKTSLLQALTGTHTAHLPEEKKRGLTIDLGYAYLPVENDTLGFIDVPGHQKFLSNMLAGLGSLQHALLVVSAEEGIKPQTDEHLRILTLLAFQHIMVVLTKADRAEPDHIQQLIVELKQRYACLAIAPFFITSAHSGQGIDDLKQHLIRLKSENDPITKPFRYAIDRVFTVKGAGVVVTGTAVAGRVKVGDELSFSGGATVRVKQIHAQNQPSEQGCAGQRLALNLANADKATITRGDWLTELPLDNATQRITVELTPLVSLKPSTVVHLYHYASHITAKVNLLNTEQAVGNGQFFAEISLDEPLHIAFGDKLVLRSGDDSQTLAGARVLEIDAPKRHKRTPQRLEYLARLACAADYPQRLALYTQQNAVEREKLAWLEQMFSADLAGSDTLTYGKWLYTHAFQQQLRQQILAKLADYHAQHNDQIGVTKARLYRIAALHQPELLVYHIIEQLLADKRLSQTRGWLHLPDHRIEFSQEEWQKWAAIQPLFAATHHALWVREIAETLSADETAIRHLLYKAGKLGYLVPIVKDRFLLHEQIVDFAQRIKGIIAEQGDISVNQLRDELQYGRKLTVQLIEYFDRSGFLRRKGNVHLLRDQDIY
ncbi:selenocysteine-specific translation elongation factor [Muribacter muris]|uniref:Selenocysteine-specific elongation factor n=1 Tax=Muribacter muris TaxID=67855 RepID=A0A4Y9JU56_9PAST|nr:selenocysteine-specific translation elongation factor [Muribacter muris]MBF0785616.1 selenocysteine-specific translation elongation factor [Muribacter muris]MBF0828032.1 selenocysteine-specific translation elongation factor [Muribacter muris]TFV09108.1 selenocysteine-specific translation elongation factor [Muribacter muris]